MHLVVVLSEEILLSSQHLPTWVDWHRAQGWEVVLATEADWDLPVREGVDDRAGRIRLWLADSYREDPGASLLLVGDPHPDTGDVPMRDTHPLQSVLGEFSSWLCPYMDPVPTDWWYAALDGTWDCDGDRRLGEYPEDAGCMDWGPELYVGRLPVRSGAELDQLLELQLAWELETDKSYRGHALLAAALLGIEGASSAEGVFGAHEDGASITEAVREELLHDWSVHRLYEGEGHLPSAWPRDRDLNTSNLVSSWEPRHGLVFTVAHGNSGGISRLWWASDSNGDELASDLEVHWTNLLGTSQAWDVAGHGGGVGFHISCDTAEPEHFDNLAYNWLYADALIATVPATRVTWTASMPWGEPWPTRPDLGEAGTLGFYFVDGLVQGRSFGEALAWPKTALPCDGWAEEEPEVDFSGVAWHTRLEFNLMGDPTRTLEACEGDEDCDDGSPCTGEETCRDGFCVHIDPIDCSHLDGDCVRGSCEPSSGECVEVERWGECDPPEDTAPEVDTGDTHDTDGEEPGGCGCGHGGGAGWVALLGLGLLLGARRR